MAGREQLLAITHGTRDPSSRFRAIQYFPGLEASGWEVLHRPVFPVEKSAVGLRGFPFLASPLRKILRARHRAELARLVPRARAIFLCRETLGGIRGLARLFAANPRVVFDFDDAIFLGEKREAEASYACRNAAWVTAGNEELADFARAHTSRVSVVPTAVPVAEYARADASRVRSRLKVGWIGSPHSIRETLFPFLPVLADIQRRIAFDLVIVSSPRPELPEIGLRWEFVGWSPLAETRIAEFFDIGIMPLQETPFQRGKCGLKLLQYFAAGLPCVASPVGVNSSIAPNGGFLASSPAEWGEALETLCSRPDLRRDLGDSGREFCAKNYDSAVWSGKIDAILAGIEDRG